MALCAVVWILPLILGVGPLWNTFDKLVEPCQSKWWTNLIWINNLYPASYDDRCLPWNWFVPCYVQLSLVLPFILMIYVKTDKSKLSVIIYACIFVASLAATFGLVYGANVGGSIATRRFEQGKEAGGEDFFAQVYTNPLFNFSSFFYGMMIALVYINYTKERLEDEEFKSLPTRFIEKIIESPMVRYMAYVAGLVLVFGSLVWQTPFVAKPTEQS